MPFSNCSTLFNTWGPLESNVRCFASSSPNKLLFYCKRIFYACQPNHETFWTILFFFCGFCIEFAWYGFQDGIIYLIAFFFNFFFYFFCFELLNAAFRFALDFRSFCVTKLLLCKIIRVYCLNANRVKLTFFYIYPSLFSHRIAERFAPRWNWIMTVLFFIIQRNGSHKFFSILFFWSDTIFT